MNTKLKKLLTFLSPLLGAGAIGVCPLCWAGSASLLTYLGLGALIPMWQWIAFGFIALGLIGFLLDYRVHKNYKPLALLLLGAVVLYFGRYVFGGAGFGGWQIWGVGAILIIVSVLYNKFLFKRNPETKPPKP
jgi:hypothetical protein